MTSELPAYLLSKEEIFSYGNNGFVVPQYRLSNHELKQLQNATLDLMSTYPHIPTEGLVSPHILYAGSNRLNLHLTFLDICKSPPLLDIIAQLIGPDIIVWGSRIFSKAAQTGRATPWHQDGEYWPIRPLAIATVWIAIDESNEENGCLKILSGSSVNRTLLPHQSLTGQGAALDREIKPDFIKDEDIVLVPLEPGQMVIFDVFTAHGASPNFSDQRRAGFAIRYMPSTSLYDRDITVGSRQNDVQTDLSQRALFLVRGENKTGKNNFTIGHDGMTVRVTP
ncbi:MAG: phytanoyl-CoA dioxygenase [Rhodospirillaceae bacterium]|nr:phytanoyl-CoA dioxygenase [Rhodospirillaceae bacterium]